jgi:N-carbamoyl-L-amino-acid hydrolase
MLRGSLIAAYIEVHIGQGPRLIEAGSSLGLVTAIAGGFRHVAARCLGRYAHSGAEPRSTQRQRSRIR